MAGFYSNRGKFRRNTGSNFLTYFFLVSTALCLGYSCLYCYRSKHEGDYDLHGTLHDMLLRRKIDDGIEEEGNDGLFRRSASSTDSKEKPLVANEFGEFT